MHNLQDPAPTGLSDCMHSPHLLISSIIINVSLSFLLRRVKQLWVEDSTSQALPKSRRSLLENNSLRFWCEGWNSHTAPLSLLSRPRVYSTHSELWVSWGGGCPPPAGQTWASQRTVLQLRPACLRLFVRSGGGQNVWRHPD